MNSRERFEATLNHREPDRVCVDLGATPVSGIAAGTLAKLRDELIGRDDYRVNCGRKIFDS